jgi:hypothetical protein
VDSSSPSSWPNGRDRGLFLNREAGVRSEPAGRARTRPARPALSPGSPAGRRPGPATEHGSLPHSQSVGGRFELRRSASRAGVGWGISGAHHPEICPELTRTTEISTPGHVPCGLCSVWSGHPLHPTRPADRLTHAPAPAGPVPVILSGSSMDRRDRDRNWTRTRASRYSSKDRCSPG